MKLAVITSDPGFELPQKLNAELDELTKKHARQMRNMLADSAKKLAKKFERLLAKEQRARARKQRKAAKAAVQNLALQVHEVFVHSVTRAHQANRPGTMAA
jgi:Skp family chaperone for outer membrane proteins